MLFLRANCVFRVGDFWLVDFWGGLGWFGLVFSVIVTRIFNRVLEPLGLDS